MQILDVEGETIVPKMVKWSDVQQEVFRPQNYGKDVFDYHKMLMNSRRLIDRLEVERKRSNICSRGLAAVR